jgi:hypothetical protein
VSVGLITHLVRDCDVRAVVLQQVFFGEAEWQQLLTGARLMDGKGSHFFSDAKLRCVRIAYSFQGSAEEGGS